ncbi:GtrA family protein [Modicisalibacter radicis]|uniref:GtrA family protein n=1 Tax=Halomonas sp. EAR18 TaxID=2518972 RepID=UPI00109D6A2D|nr:GtrA family protein [Halomonas sp. EAR18]
MRRLTEELTTLVRFGGVGVFATLVHLAVAAAVFWFWASISPFLANVLAFLVAFQVSLWGHRRFTFRRRGHSGRFFLVAVAGFAANNGILASLLATTSISGLSAVAISTLLVPLVMFLAARLWAFA